MWVTKLLISPVKKGFFAQQRPILAQNWHFWSIWARPCRLIQCPVVGRLVVFARGLYLARHLFTLYDILYTTYIILKIINGSHSEWENSNLDHLHNADQSRHTAERIRAEVEFVFSRSRGSSINPQKIPNLGLLV